MNSKVTFSEAYLGSNQPLKDQLFVDNINSLILDTSSSRESHPEKNMIINNMLKKYGLLKENINTINTNIPLEDEALNRKFCQLSKKVKRTDKKLTQQVENLIGSYQENIVGAKKIKEKELQNTVSELETLRTYTHCANISTQSMDERINLLLAKAYEKKSGAKISSFSSKGNQNKKNNFFYINYQQKENKKEKNNYQKRENRRGKNFFNNTKRIVTAGLTGIVLSSMITYSITKSNTNNELKANLPNQKATYGLIDGSQHQNIYSKDSVTKEDTIQENSESIIQNSINNNVEKKYGFEKNKDLKAHKKPTITKETTYETNTFKDEATSELENNFGSTESEVLQKIYSIEKK
ncbi:MAG: hypothetical protein ACQESC_02280 [Nanobdellota archaeon]